MLGFSSLKVSDGKQSSAEGDVKKNTQLATPETTKEKDHPIVPPLNLTKGTQPINCSQKHFRQSITGFCVALCCLCEYKTYLRMCGEESWRSE